MEPEGNAGEGKKWGLLSGLCGRLMSLLPSSGPPSPETFTPRSIKVLNLAYDEAERLHHNFIETEHLLFGLSALGQGVAFKLLKKNGLDFDGLKAEIAKMTSDGNPPKAGARIPFSPQAKKVLKLAGEEAKGLGHVYIGTVHILLGLLSEGEGIAAKVLIKFNVDMEKTRVEIRRELPPNNDKH